MIKLPKTWHTMIALFVCLLLFQAALYFNEREWYLGAKKLDNIIIINRIEMIMVVVVVQISCLAKM